MIKYKNLLTFFVAFFWALIFPGLSYSNMDVSSYHDGNILELVSLFLPQNPIILEAGAHLGVDTIRMKTLWPESTIYAFEPHPTTYNILKKRTSSLMNVHCYHMALCDFVGECSFHVSSYADGTSSILESSDWHSWAYNDLPEISVPCITIDYWAKIKQISPIDFIWFDLEGAELIALKHGVDVLKNVKAIYTEVNFQEYRNGMVQYKELAAFFKSIGFEQIYITPKGTYDTQANALFVNTAFYHIGDEDSSF